MSFPEHIDATLQFQGLAIGDVLRGEITKADLECWLAEQQEEKPETLNDPLWLGVARALHDLPER